MKKSRVYIGIAVALSVVLLLSGCEWVRDVFGIDPDIKVGPRELADAGTANVVTANTTKEALMPTLEAIFGVTGASVGGMLPSVSRSVGGGVNFFIKNEPIFGYVYQFAADGTITDSDWQKIGHTNSAEVAAQIEINEDSSLIDDDGEVDFKSVSVELKGGLDLEFEPITRYYDYEGWGDWTDVHYLYRINDGYLKAFTNGKAKAEITQKVTQAMINAGWVDQSGWPLESWNLGDPAKVSASYDVSSGVTLAISVDGSVDTQGLIFSGKYILTVTFKAKSELVVDLVFATAAEAESAQEQIFTSEEIVMVVEAYNNQNNLINTWEYSSTEFFESGGVEALYTPFYQLLSTR